MQILGLDILLDSSLAPHLLELNANPSLSVLQPADPKECRCPAWNTHRGSKSLLGVGALPRREPIPFSLCLAPREALRAAVPIFVALGSAHAL